MNAAGRKEISKIIEQLHEISARVQEMGMDEREKFANLPEGLQMSERGEQYENAAEALENAADDGFGDLITALEEAME